jgi:hypothetical protein
MSRLRGHCICRAADTGSSNLEEEEEERKWNLFHNSKRSTNDWFGSMRKWVGGWLDSGGDFSHTFSPHSKKSWIQRSRNNEERNWVFLRPGLLGYDIAGTYVCACTLGVVRHTYIGNGIHRWVCLYQYMICSQGLLPVITASFAKLSCMRITKNLLSWTGWVVTVPY